MALRSWLQSLRSRCVGYAECHGSGSRAGGLRNRDDLRTAARGFIASSRTVRTSRRVADTPAEALEARAMLSVSTLLTGSVVTGMTLDIVADGPDTIIVRANVSGQVEVLDQNGRLPIAPSVDASAVTAILIAGSDSANVVDLSGATAVQFTSLTSISVNTSDGDDVITGSPDFGDSVKAGDGNDTVFGGGGNDTLDGGNGNDSLAGADGNDSFIGGDGRDTLDGGNGNDTILSGNGNDTVSCGAGDDSVFAGNGEDSLLGEAGNDTLNGDGGTDTISGGDDDDSILGGELNDSLVGGIGNDTLNGQAGNDTLDGGAGNDSLLGGDGQDSAGGGDGDDLVNGQADNDMLEGGAGNDNIFGGAGNDFLNDDFADQGNSGTGRDTMQGQGGNDTVISRGGPDSLDGGVGNDVLDSRAITVSVSDARVDEGDTGTTTLNFVISLSIPLLTSLTVTFDTTTQTGTAIAGLDYLDTSGSIVFAPGQTSATVSVTVLNDTDDESVEENVLLTIAVPAASSIVFDNTGDGRIVDNDPTPTVPPVDVFLLSDDRASFGRVFPSLQAEFPTVVSTLIAALPGVSLGFGIGRFEGYHNGRAQIGRPLILNQPIITTDTPQFNAALDAALARGNPGVGDGRAVMIEALHQLATGVGFDGNGNGTTTDTSVGTLFQQQTTISASGDVPAFDPTAQDLTSDPNGPILPASGTLGGVGFRPGTLRIVFVAEDAATRFRDDGGLTTYSGSGSTVPAQSIQVGGSTQAVPANGAQIQPTIDELISLGVRIVGLGGLGGFGFDPTDPATQPRSPLESLALLTGSANNSTSALDSQIPSDPINPGEPLYFVIDPDSGDALANAIVQAVIGTVGQVPPPPPPAPPPPAPNNGPQEDTLIGGDGIDAILAGDSNDLINGGAGADSIDGGGGNDSIFGGAGADTLNGGTGNDSLIGQGGPDVIESGSGDDQIVWDGASGGQDTASSSTGYDTLVVNGSVAMNTYVVGKDLTDRLTITETGTTFVVASTINNVVINGNGGNDTITVAALNGVAATSLAINGGTGDDTLSAAGVAMGNVRLRLSGEAGNDSLIGSTSDDTLDGGDGDDVLGGGAGNDTLFGGVGLDRINGNEGDDSMSGEDGDDTLRGGTGNDSISGGTGSDMLEGGDGGDNVAGDAGADTIAGEAGNDLLQGNSGQDMLTGGDGADTLEGGTENDVLTADLGDDLLRGGDGHDTLDGGDGLDTLVGGDGDDSLIGSLGNDGLNGGHGNDTINGGAGKDSILGGDGNDILLGGADADTCLGGDGDDTINGQGGTDLLAGNEGNDTLTDATAIINEAFTFSAAVLSALEA